MIIVLYSFLSNFDQFGADVDVISQKSTKSGVSHKSAKSSTSVKSVKLKKRNVELDENLKSGKNQSTGF